jgi:hypothetical protein
MIRETKLCCLVLIGGVAGLFAGCNSSAEQKPEEKPAPGAESRTAVVTRPSRTRAAVTPPLASATETAPAAVPVPVTGTSSPDETTSTTAMITTTTEPSVEYVENGIGVEAVPPAERMSEEDKQKVLPEQGEIPLVIRYKGEITGYARVKLMEPTLLRVRLQRDDRTPAIGRNDVRVSVESPSAPTIDRITAEADGATVLVRFLSPLQTPAKLGLDIDSDSFGHFEGTVTLK